MASGRKTGGRLKGTPNKLTANLKAAIEGALDAVGGQRYLERVARKRPQVFCALLAKLIPKDLTVTAPVVTDEKPVDPLVVARQIALALYLGDRELEAREADRRRSGSGSTTDASSALLGAQRGERPGRQ